MKTFLKEFKAFAVRGNVIDLAIAVVIGGAFSKIVASLVDNIIMPIIGVFLGGVDFSRFAYKSLQYGMFVQSVIDFLIIALVVFLAIKAVGRMKRKEEQKEEEKPKEPSEEVLLLREIRDSVKR